MSQICRLCLMGLQDGIEPWLAIGFIPSWFYQKQSVRNKLGGLSRSQLPSWRRFPVCWTRWGVDIPWPHGDFPSYHSGSTGWLGNFSPQRVKSNENSSILLETGWPRPISSYAHPLFNKGKTCNQTKPVGKNALILSHVRFWHLPESSHRLGRELISFSWNRKHQGSVMPGQWQELGPVPETLGLREPLDRIWEVTPTPGQCVLGTRG